MVITSEQIWDVATQAEGGADERDAYVLGLPSSGSLTEAFHLRHDVDPMRFLRSATSGFFDERDPACPVRSTLAKIIGVVIALTGITLVTLGGIAALGVWTIKAVLG